MRPESEIREMLGYIELIRDRDGHAQRAADACKDLLKFVLGEPCRADKLFQDFRQADAKLKKAVGNN